MKLYQKIILVGTAVATVLTGSLIYRNREISHENQFQNSAYHYTARELHNLQSPRSQFYSTKDTVDMNDGKWGDETARLNTYGLMGCYGVLVYTSHNGENRQGILTHYDPTNILANGKKLEELIGQHPDMKTATTKKAVILHAIDNETQMNYLESTLKTKLGADTDIQREKVSMQHEAGRHFQGQVWYNVGQANWFISGGGGKFE